MLLFDTVDTLQSSHNMRAGLATDADLTGFITARTDTASAAEACALGRERIKPAHFATDRHGTGELGLASRYPRRESRRLPKRRPTTSLNRSSRTDSSW
jgi:hypothetical protein